MIRLGARAVAFTPEYVALVVARLVVPEFRVCFPPVVLELRGRVTAEDSNPVRPCLGEYALAFGACSLVAVECGLAQLDLRVVPRLSCFVRQLFDLLIAHFQCPPMPQSPAARKRRG